MMCLLPLYFFMEWKSHFEINMDIPNIDSEFNNGTVDVFDDSQIWEWLSNFKGKTLSNYKLTHEEQKIINNIDNSEVFQPVETLKNFIDEKNWFKVIREIFMILWRLILSKNEVWYKEFNDIGIDSLNFDEKSEEGLIWFMNFIEWKIDSTVDIKKILKFTYFLSVVKNKLLEKKSIIDKEEQLKNNLAVWDIILLNKQLRWKDIWTRLLEAYDDNYDTDFWHVAIVISTDPIRIRHSTTENLKKGDRKWFVEDAELDWYLDKCGCSWYDIIVLRPNHDIKNDILCFSKSKIGKQYDNRTALRQWLWLKKQYNDKYNCVELIVQWLNPSNEKDPLSELKIKAFPNDFFEYMDLFKPVYLTTIMRS